MSYALAKKEQLFNGSMQVTNPEGQSLALQHLDYTLTIERNRAALTQHAMGNTAILMNVAGEIVNDNPGATGAVREIMTAYLDATGNAIRKYGNPSKYR